MDHNMVFGYGYCWWQNQQWYQHVLPLLAILMAMAVCWCNTKHIAQCSMSRATPEATGCHHWATTCSVLPQPPGQQANKQQSTNIPTKLAVSMAMAMQRYVTARIAQWRRSRASLLEATGRRHQACILSNNIKGTWLCWFFLMFFIAETVEIGHAPMLRPSVFNRGMTYQTKEKGLMKVSL